MSSPPPTTGRPGSIGPPGPGGPRWTPNCAGAATRSGGEPHKVVALARSGNNIVLQALVAPAGRRGAESARAQHRPARYGGGAQSGRHAGRHLERIGPDFDGQGAGHGDGPAGLHLAGDHGVGGEFQRGRPSAARDRRRRGVSTSPPWPPAAPSSGADGPSPATARAIPLPSAPTTAWWPSTRSAVEVQVGRVATARPFEAFNQHGQLSSAAFNSHRHPAGPRIVGRQCHRPERGHRQARPGTGRPHRGVNGVVYGSRDRYIITTSIDDTMRVWNATTGQLMQVDHDLSAPGAPSVSPDGALVAETNNDNQVRVWAVCPRLPGSHRPC